MFRKKAGLTERLEALDQAAQIGAPYLSPGNREGLERVRGKRRVLRQRQQRVGAGDVAARVGQARVLLEKRGGDGQESNLPGRAARPHQF